MGSYLSSPIARIFLGPQSFTRPSFLIGLALWFIGFTGNILHDEILLDIRRKAQSKGKGKVEKKQSESCAPNETEKPRAESKLVQQEYYAIPRGWLYSYISYPNYLCEWIEWLGFALAAAPFPYPVSSFSELFSWKTLLYPSYAWEPNMTPPWIFLIAEVMTMLPRAYRGHQWYKLKFKDSYPKERRAIVPFLI